MSFWANKLNGTPPPPPPIPSRDMFFTTQSLPQAPEAQWQSIPGKPDEYQPSVRLKQGGTCPGCGSDKYMQVGDRAVACGECGYHPRFEQSGYGERSLFVEKGAVQAARQSGDHQTMAGSIANLNSGGGDHIHQV